MPKLPFTLPGFEIQQISQTEAVLTITAQAINPGAICPRCQQISSHIHSYYTRIPQDLPVSGQTVHLLLHVRRFRCPNRHCRQQTFVERLPEVVPFYARRTTRLGSTLSLFATALSGQAGARLLKPIGMAVSAGTLVRIAKRAITRSAPTPTILGVDDFAFRRGRTYGTVLVDLEKHQIIDLLAERTAEALIAWLKDHPGVKVISRDRATEYARGASVGAPQAIQVADRWHLLKNLQEAAERALKRVHAELVEKLKASDIPQQQRYKRRRSQTEIRAAKVARLRRQARYEEVVALYQQGMSMVGIAEQLQMSRGTVRNFVSAGAFPERATSLRSQSLLNPYIPYLEQRFAQGCRNATKLWKELQEQGFAGEYKLVNRWLEPRREKPGRKHSQREKQWLQITDEEAAGTTSDQTPASLSEATVQRTTAIALEAPRHLVWLLIRDVSELDEQEQRALQFLREQPTIADLYALVQSYFRLVRERDAEALDPWIKSGLTSGIPDLVTFAQGIQKDYSTVRAALLLPYSNGPVEGKINKLKYIKRSMYGRSGFPLLRQKVLKAG